MTIFYIQIIVFAVGALMFLLLRRMTKSGEKMLAEQKRRIETAPKARARIVSVGKSRAQKHNGRILVNLRLEVFPLDLRPSFQAATVWEIEPAKIGEIEPEKMLSVKFDEHERSRIYPLAPWANFSLLHHQYQAAGNFDK